jgi:2-oxoisovalerate dehydrogenase E1 component beta subunit
VPELTYIQAISDGLRQEMRRDERVFVLGEDVGVYGGAFKVTQGFQEEFGPWRVIDTPLSETAIVGGATGAALMGLRPVAEMQFADFISCAWDHLVTVAAKQFFRGRTPVPIVVRLPSGGGFSGGPFHSQNPESSFAHIPGLKIVCPSTPHDAKGLLLAAIADPDPVIFFEPKRIYNGPFEGHHDRPVTPWAKHPASEVPDGHYTVPLGKASVVREGTELTVLTYGTMVHVSLAAVEAQGIDAEVIDLRTLVPLDIAAIEESVEKTGRCLVVQEAPRTSGFGAELAALVQERCFYHLESPVERVTGWDTPYPHAYEWAYFPGPKRLKRALEKVMAD